MMTSKLFNTFNGIAIVTCIFHSISDCHVYGLYMASNLLLIKLKNDLSPGYLSINVPET